METLELEKPEQTAKLKIMSRFVVSIRGKAALLTKLDVVLWSAIVDSVIVSEASGVVFTSRMRWRLQYKDSTITSRIRNFYF